MSFFIDKIKVIRHKHQKVTSLVLRSDDKISLTNINSTRLYSSNSEYFNDRKGITDVLMIAGKTYFMLNLNV